MALPKTITPEGSLETEVPGDITLGEYKSTFGLSPVAQNLASISKKGEVCIRFISGPPHAPDMKDGKRVELPDDMTFETLRVLIDKQRAHIAIDDNSGGFRARVPEPAF